MYFSRIYGVQETFRYASCINPKDIFLSVCFLQVYRHVEKGHVEGMKERESSQSFTISFTKQSEMGNFNSVADAHFSELSLINESGYSILGGQIKPTNYSFFQLEPPTNALKPRLLH